MRWGVSFALVCLAIGGGRAEDDVVSLTDANFDEVVTQSKDSWLLKFYAPWCGHCKKLAPIWDEMATEVVGQLLVGKIDCTVEKATASAYGVKNYPTLKFYRDGAMRPYKGGRSVVAFKKFARDVTSAPVTEVSAHTLNKAVQENPVSFVLLGAKAGGEEASTFDKVAYRRQGLFDFMTPKNAEAQEQIATKQGIAAVSSPMVVYLSEGADLQTYSGPWVAEELEAWIDDHSLPVVSELGPANFDDVTSATGKLTVFAITDPEATSSEAFRGSFLEVAKELNGQAVFANIDGIRFKQYVTQFGFSPSNSPAVFVLDHPNEYYWTSEELTNAGGLEPPALTTAMLGFVKGVLAGDVSAQSTIAWYSPSRAFKKFDKWASQFTDTQLFIGLGVVTLVIGGLMFWGCSACDIAEEEEEGVRQGGITEISPEEFKKDVATKSANPDKPKAD